MTLRFPNSAQNEPQKAKWFAKQQELNSQTALNIQLLSQFDTYSKMFSSRKEPKLQTPLKSIKTTVNIPDQKASQSNAKELLKVKMIRKTASAPTFDMLDIDENLNNRVNMNSPTKNNVLETPFKMNRIESITMSEEPEHKPHKYYNFPVRNKHKTVTSKQIIPNFDDEKIFELTKIDEPEEPPKEEVIEPIILQDPKTARNSVSSSNRLNQKFVYKIEKSRLSVDKQKDYRLFINNIYQRQDQRKKDKKAKDRKLVSTNEYIDDYFMRQLGYSVLRM